MSRKNISISDPIEQRARDVMRLRGIAGLSALLDILVREEWERRHPEEMVIRDSPVNSKDAAESAKNLLKTSASESHDAANVTPPPQKPTSYKARRRSRKPPPASDKP